MADPSRDAQTILALITLAIIQVDADFTNPTRIAAVQSTGSTTIDVRLIAIFDTVVATHARVRARATNAYLVRAALIVCETLSAIAQAIASARRIVEDTRGICRQIEMHTGVGHRVADIACAWI